MTIRDLIDTRVEERITSQSLTDICFGKVTSIEPLKIQINKDIIIEEDNILLTEGVIRKEFHIAVHTHLFEKNTFKHAHSDQNMLTLGTDWDIKALMYMGGLIAPAPSAAIPPATMSIQGSASTGQINLKNGKKDYDLSHDSDSDFETLTDPEPTQSRVTVMINGEEYPLSKDPDGATEDDEDGTDKYWAVLNYGLHKDDLVLLLRCQQDQTYVVLSKLYEKYKFREDD